MGLEGPQGCPKESRRHPKDIPKKAEGITRDKIYFENWRSTTQTAVVFIDMCIIVAHAIVIGIVILNLIIIVITFTYVYINMRMRTNNTYR